MRLPSPSSLRLLTAAGATAALLLTTGAATAQQAGSHAVAQQAGSAAAQQGSSYAVAQQGSGSHSFWVNSGQGDADHQLRVDRFGDRVVFVSEPDPDDAWLGVLFEPQSGDVSGARIRSVAEGSPASAAGLAVGDVVVSVDGEPLGAGGHSHLSDIFDQRRPGDTVRLGVVRENGDEETLVARLGEHPGRVEFDTEGGGVFSWSGETLGDGIDGQAFFGGKWKEALGSLSRLPSVPCVDREGDDCFAYAFLSGFDAGPRLGVSVESLSDQLAEFFGVEAGEGVLVSEVIEGSAAEEAGLEAGDIIVAVGDSRVGRPGDIRRALSGAASGDILDVEIVRRGRTLVLPAVVPERDAAQGALHHGLHGLRSLERELRGEPLEDLQRALEEALHGDALEELEPAMREKLAAALERSRRALRGAERNLRLGIEERRADRAQREAETLQRQAEELQRRAEELQRRAQEREERAERHRAEQLERGDLEREERSRDSGDDPRPSPNALPL